MDFAPTSRPRFLRLLVRDVALPPAPLVRLPLVMLLGCLVDLPPCLSEPCIISAQLMRTYLDPSLIPGSPSGLRKQTPQAYRFRGADSHAGCIMASYQFQHKLPENCLRRNGLLTTLCATASGPRFFSGLEISMMHCAVRPSDSRLQTRILGNSLAVAQGLACLARAACLIKRPGDDNMLQRLMDMCMSLRIHNHNFIVFPSDLGWVTCRMDQAHPAAAVLPSACRWVTFPLGWTSNLYLLSQRRCAAYSAAGLHSGSP